MNLLQITAEKPPLQPDIIFKIFDWPITNSILMSWLVMLLLIVICWQIRQTKNKKHSYFKNIVEILYESIINLLNQITGSKKYSEKLTPLIGTLIIFIGFGNLIGLIPIVTSFTWNGLPIFRTPTNDFNLTFSLALAMVLLTQLVSIKDYGFFGHIGKYLKFKEVFLGFKESIGAGFMAIIEFAIGLLDIISEFAKIISLSLRLFGNMFAGETLAVIILSALAYGLPSVWLAMNLLVAVVQTIVFGSLTAAYYMMAVKPEELSEETQNI